MYMNLLLSTMTSFSFQIKVNVVNMRDAKVQEVGHHPKARKKPVSADKGINIVAM